MPTPKGLPKVGEYLVAEDGTRWKVVRRTTNNKHCSVFVEDKSKASGQRHIAEVMWWIKTGKFTIQS